MIQNFPNGVLRMAESATEQVQVHAQWADNIVVVVLIGLSAVLCLVNLRGFLRIWPALLDCFGRWKGNVDMEHSISLSRERNMSVFVLMFPTCLIFDRYNMYTPEFMTYIGSIWSPLILLAIAGGWILIQHLCGFLLIKPFTLGSEHILAARHSYLNFFILFAVLALPTVLFFDIFGASDGTIHTVLSVEALFFVAFAMLRETQILRFGCNPLFTFLYLCALEILPIGILFLSANVL